MGVTNFDNLVRNTVRMRLINDRQTINEQKGSFQVLSGANMVYYSVRSSATLQKIAAADTTLNIEVAFVSTTVLVPLADMIAEVSTSPDGVTYTAIPDFPNYGDPNFYIYDQHGTSLIPFTAKFALIISNVPSTWWVRVNVQFLANGSGTI